MNENKNYDAAFCGNLAIHQTNSIQDYGFLLVVDIDTLEIVQGSENVDLITSKPIRELIGANLSDFITDKELTGLKTEIEVRNDSTYTLSSQALGQEDKPRIFNGTYHFNTVKSTITLDAEGDHLKFLVQDDMLKKLDKFGDPEQGAPQEKYLLRRVQ